MFRLRLAAGSRCVEIGRVSGPERRRVKPAAIHCLESSRNVKSANIGTMSVSHCARRAWSSLRIASVSVGVYAASTGSNACAWSTRRRWSAVANAQRNKRLSDERPFLGRQVMPPPSRSTRRGRYENHFFHLRQAMLPATVNLRDEKGPAGTYPAGPWEKPWLSLRRSASATAPDEGQRAKGAHAQERDRRRFGHGIEGAGVTGPAQSTIRHQLRQRLSRCERETQT